MLRTFNLVVHYYARNNYGRSVIDKMQQRKNMYLLFGLLNEYKMFLIPGKLILD